MVEVLVVWLFIKVMFCLPRAYGMGMFSGEASLLNVQLGSWEVVLYALALKTFSPQKSEGTLRIHVEIYIAFGASPHSIQEAIGQEYEK